MALACRSCGLLDVSDSRHPDRYLRSEGSPRPIATHPILRYVQRRYLQGNSGTQPCHRLGAHNRLQELLKSRYSAEMVRSSWHFTESDNADNQLVIIVNREFAEHYWPHQDPIGKRMRIGTLKAPTPWMTVVGEVADAKLTSPDADASEQFYQPVAQLEKDAGPLAQPTDINGNGNYIVLVPRSHPRRWRTLCVPPFVPLTRNSEDFSVSIE